MKLRFRLTQLRDQLFRGAHRLTNSDDLIEEVVLVVLDHPPIVRKSSDAEALIFALPTLEKCLPVGAEEAEKLVRDGNSEGRLFSIFMNPSASPSLLGTIDSENNFVALAAITAKIRHQYSVHLA